MMKGARRGDRCQVLSGNEPRTSGMVARIDGFGKRWQWDFSKGNTGIVRSVTRDSSYVFVYVRPDPGFGNGELVFVPRDLRRIVEADHGPH